MRTSLGSDELEAYVRRLLAHHIPDAYDVGEMSTVVGAALDRLAHCFSRIRRKYYCDGSETVFDHLNGDHFASFLYFLSNSAWRMRGEDGLATRLFYLNKIMHGLDLFYSVEMPDVFMLVHPVGTVLGRATYRDYLVVYQNCTVGADTTVYPSFGEGVVLYSRTSVLGACNVGDNVVFAANSLVIDSDVPSDSLVVGQYPNHRVLPNRRPVRTAVFGEPADLAQ